MRFGVFVVAAILMAQPALALDFTVVLKTADGQDAQECGHVDTTGKCDKLAVLTLGRFIAGALSQPKKQTVTEQVIDGRLAARVIDAKNLDLTSDEIVRIKERIGELTYNPSIVANAIELLDPGSIKDLK